jgi:hypothetical protein
MDLPWHLLGVGPRARSLYITTAGECFGNKAGDATTPQVRIRETDSKIDIRAFARGIPAIHHGRLDTTCSQSQVVALSAPIRGRPITGQSWPTHLGFGAMRNQAGTVLPRLLGLAPPQAARLLWVDGIHARIDGHGQQVVAQIPGWDLIDPPRSAPLGVSPGHPAALIAGDRVSIPTSPPLTPGAPTGRLIGKLSGLYTHNPQPIVVFDRRGRLLARMSVPGQGPFGLKLNPGRYFLLKDNEAWTRCGPARVHIRPGQVARATVAYACD